MLPVESLGLSALCNALLTLVGIWMPYLLFFFVSATFAHYFNVADLLYTTSFILSGTGSVGRSMGG